MLICFRNKWHECSSLAALSTVFSGNSHFGFGNWTFESRRWSPEEQPSSCRHTATKERQAQPKTLHLCDEFILYNNNPQKQKQPKHLKVRYSYVYLSTELIEWVNYISNYPASFVRHKSHFITIYFCISFILCDKAASNNYFCYQLIWRLFSQSSIKH